MNLFIIRHAQSLLNIGKGDTPNAGLSELGSKQAQSIGEFFKEIKISHLYCSPLRRVIQTAAPLAREKGLTIELIPQLSEIFNEGWKDYRDHNWESCDSILQEFENVRFTDTQKLDEKWWPTWPENQADVAARVKEFYTNVLQPKVAEGSEENIVVVGHWASAAALKQLIDPEDKAAVPNAGIFEYYLDAETAYPVQMNLRHLRGRITY